MSDTEEDSKPSRRAELKKLQFQKSQELKKAKNKNEKIFIEDKFSKFETDLLGVSNYACDKIDEQASAPQDLYSSSPRETSRSQKKKEEKALRESEKKREILAQVGDGSFETKVRDSEIIAIQSRIPNGFVIHDIPADGDCMFSSICMYLTNLTHQELRNEIANYLEQHEDELSPFLDDEDVSSFGEYVESVRSNRWGGQMELEAVSRISNKKILVYTSSNILEFGEADGEPIRLSFHEHQMTSNHYNAVVIRFE